MDPTVINVLGDPKAQPRPKAFARRFKSGQVMARVYTPGTAEEWKSQIALAAREFVPMPPLVGPLRVDIEFRFSRPKSHYLTKGLRQNAPHWHTSRPDRDNLDKAVMDALTTIGFWCDDSQVCAGEVTKIYVEERPGAVITVTQLGPEPQRVNEKQLAMLIPT